MQKVLNHLKNLDWILIGSAASLYFIGLINLYAFPADRDLFEKQALFGILAFLIILIVSAIDYRALRDNPIFLVGIYLAGLVALFLLFIVGQKVRGISAWFFVGGFAIQPVEVVKIFLIMVLAKYLSGRHIELYRLRHLFISALYAFIPAAMVLVQPDLGSAIIIIGLWIGMVVLSGIRLKQFFLIFILGIVVLVILWSFGLHDYQKQRVTSFLNPEQDPLGGGYQTRQAVIALGSGGFFGKGLGEGTQTRLGFLPEYQSDFVFAAIGEEWGLFGVLIVLGLWTIIFARFVNAWNKSTNNFARLLIGGVLFFFLSHFAINIGTNLALLPVTGLPLPFVSYGGSNLISAALALGIVLSIYSRSPIHSSVIFTKEKELDSLYYKNI